MKSWRGIKYDVDTFESTGSWPNDEIPDWVSGLIESGSTMTEVILWAYRKIAKGLEMEVHGWKEAWWNQRDATGFNYWDGFRKGIMRGKDEI